LSTSFTEVTFSGEGAVCELAEVTFSGEGAVCELAEVTFSGESPCSPLAEGRSGLKMGIHDALRLDRPFLDRERSGRSGGALSALTIFAAEA
jgi:hypothetical protein